MSAVPSHGLDQRVWSTCQRPDVRTQCSTNEAVLQIDVIRSLEEDEILGEHDSQIVVNLEHHLPNVTVAELGQQLSQTDPLASSRDSSHVL